MRQTIRDHVTFGLFIAALPDMLGSVDIGMRFPSARATPKLGLITSVALLTVATLRARPAGVVRVDQLHQDSCQCRLISDHLAQLPEPPRVQNPSLAVPNFYPRADSFQLLHTDSAPGAFSRANDLLANTVVDMASETRFSPRQLLQSAFGGTRLLGLQSSPQLPVPPAHILHLRAGVAASIRIASQVRYPQIHSQKLNHSSGFRHIHVRGGGCQLESLAAVDQIALTLLPLQQLTLPVPALKWHPAPARHSPQRDGLGFQIPTQDARIVRESPIGSELPLGALIERVGIHHLGDPPHGHLSRQTKALADLVVDQLMERQLSEGLVMPRLLANPIGSLESAAQSIRVGRRELDRDGQSRNRSIEQDQLKVNRLKGGGIRPGI